MRGEGGHIQVVFDDVVGFLEAGFDIALVDVGVGDVALLGGIVASSPAVSSSETAALFSRGSRPDDRCIGLSAFAQVDDVGKHFPFHIELPQGLFAGVFVFGDDDDGDFGPFLVREVVEKPSAA